MAKKGSGKTYVSKGERPNVSQKTKNLMRRELNENPPADVVLARMEHRNFIIENAKSPEEKRLKEKYLNERRVHFDAWKLIDQYREVGLTKGEAIHAVKTNFTENLHRKWSKKLKAYHDSLKN